MTEKLFEAALGIGKPRFIAGVNFDAAIRHRFEGILSWVTSMSQPHSSRRFLNLISTFLLCGILLALAACGGSDSGSGIEPTPSFSVGGTVTGLNGTVVVQNNGGDDLTLTADGSFTFPTALPDGSAYALTVLTNPSSPVHQTCTPSNDSGTTNGTNVTNIAIVCSTNSYTVGGNVAGLTGTVVLQNNAGDDLSLSANGSFTFATSVADAASYDVTILTQPAGQICSVVNSSGTVNGSNVTHATVICSTFAYVTHLSPDAFNTSQIQQYLLGQDGLLSFSENATQIDGHYGQMAFATANGTQYAYILENGVIYCSINSDGTFNNCTPTTAPTNGVNHPHGIAWKFVASLKQLGIKADVLAPQDFPQRFRDQVLREAVPL